MRDNDGVIQRQHINNYNFFKYFTIIKKNTTLKEKISKGTLKNANPVGQKYFAKITPDANPKNNQMLGKNALLGGYSTFRNHGEEQ